MANKSFSNEGGIQKKVDEAWKNYQKAQKKASTKTTKKVAKKPVKRTTKRK